MADFKDIDKARNILGLGEYASWDEIRQAYLKLARQYHPDHCPKDKIDYCQEKFKKINWAKDIITNYCLSYRFSFKEEDVKRNSIPKQEYDYLKQFFDGWWGELNL